MKDKITSSSRLPGLFEKNGIYYYRTGTGKNRKCYSLQTRDYAEAVKRALEIKSAAPLHRKGELQAMIDEFVEHKSSRGKHSRFSTTEKAGVLTRFAKFCGDHCSLQHLSPQKIGEYFADCQRRELASSTLAGYKATLHGFFSWCRDEKRMLVSEFLKALAGFHFEATARKDFLPLEQIRVLINACTDDRIKYVLICGAYLGMRKNEIIESRTSWFDFNRNVCFIQNCDEQTAKCDGLDTFRIKNGHEREVPITRDVQDWLKSFVSGKEYCLASDARRGRSKYRYDYERPFKDFLKAQGLVHVSSHTLRHSFATNLAILNVAIGKIAAMLGDSIKTTEKHYARFIPDQSSVDVFSAAPSPPPIPQSPVTQELAQAA